MTDKEIGKNTYDDGNIPEIDLPGRADTPSGRNRYGDLPIGDPGNSNTDPSGNGNPDSSGESNLVWVTPPVLLSESEGLAPNAAGGI